MAVRSVGPYQSTTAVGTSDRSGFSPVRGAPSSLVHTAAITARWPPADSPHSTTRSASRSNSAACPRSHRTAALTSSSIPAKPASRASR
jgi:hypothetical protein